MLLKLLVCNVLPWALAGRLLAPLLGTFCALIEGGHGLIRTTDLQLVPVRLIVAALLVGTLDCGGLALLSWNASQPASQPASLEKLTLSLVHVVPGALAAQNVLDFLLLQVLALVVALVDDEVVRAGEAFEAVLAYVLLDCRVSWRYAADAQHVAAGWADCDGWLVRYRLWFEARDEWV
jgi:hypothetical protein